MGLFSRRKKSDDVQDAAAAASPDGDEATQHAAVSDRGPESSAEVRVPDEAAEVVPSIGISVQAFRGVGAQAGPEVSLPDPDGTAPAS
ncbi:MAG TPA: hypothetical protein VN241_14765, partial [Microbacterium sp.]|nr:hypothetical protein [Microbacterium sp.]